MKLITDAAIELGIELLPWQIEAGRRYLDGEMVVLVGGQRVGRATLRRVIAHAENSANGSS